MHRIVGIVVMWCAACGGDPFTSGDVDGGTLLERDGAPLADRAYDAGSESSSSRAADAADDHDAAPWAQESGSAPEAAADAGDGGPLLERDGAPLADAADDHDAAPWAQESGSAPEAAADAGDRCVPPADAPAGCGCVAAPAAGCEGYARGCVWTRAVWHPVCAAECGLVPAAPDSGC